MASGGIRTVSFLTKMISLRSGKAQDSWNLCVQQSMADSHISRQALLHTTYFPSEMCIVGYPRHNQHVSCHQASGIRPYQTGQQYFETLKYNSYLVILCPSPHV